MPSPDLIKTPFKESFPANVLFLSKDIEKWGSGINDVCNESSVKVEKTLKGFLLSLIGW